MERLVTALALQTPHARVTLRLRGLHLPRRRCHHHPTCRGRHVLRDQLVSGRTDVRAAAPALQRLPVATTGLAGVGQAQGLF